jgi:hypothetical protein
MPSAAYYRAESIRRFSIELHFVSGTGLNTTMSNGSFFRVRPGTSPSGAYSGYPAAFPYQFPYAAKLETAIMTFRVAAFDFNATAGPVLWELETRAHVYNGSSVYNRLLMSFGTFSGNSTGTDTWRFELTDNGAADSFSYIEGDAAIDYGEMIGFRFVKAPSGDRRINSFTDIILKLNYMEAF